MPPAARFANQRNSGASWPERPGARAIGGARPRRLTVAPQGTPLAQQCETGGVVKRANDNDKRVVTVSLGELREMMREIVHEAREDAAALEVSKRLANIEALQRLLLERRRGSVRAGTKRSVSMRERLRNEAEQHPDQPSERDFRIAREMQARAARR